jgi:septum formation protein
LIVKNVTLFKCIDNNEYLIKKKLYAHLIMIKLSKLLLLASGSPRRQSLLKTAGYSFLVENANVSEDFPPNLDARNVGEFLARKKADFFTGRDEGKIILTADTVVVLKDRILDKPKDAEQAYRTLKALSGEMHEVITGVAFLHDGTLLSFQDTSLVYFKKLLSWEIEYYIDNYKPYDKAGGYGIQEWIGMIGIEKIEGSYFNVMGLPIHRVHEYLSKFRI